MSVSLWLFLPPHVVAELCAFLKKEYAHSCTIILFFSSTSLIPSAFIYLRSF
jgi:hypothetical protein